MKNIIILGLSCFIASFIAFNSGKQYTHDYQYNLLVKNTEFNDLNKLLISKLPSYKCSWYGYGERGLGVKSCSFAPLTASGEPFNENAMTCAAKKSIPMGSRILLINSVNGKYLIVIVNDRGTFYSKKYGYRDLDLSKYVLTKENGE